MMTTVEKRLKEAPRHTGYILTISIIVLAIFIWSLTSINLENVDEKGLQIAKSIIGGIFHPDLSLFNLSKESVPYLLVETLAIAFLGTLVGAILSVPFAFFAASNIVPKPVSWLTRLFLIVIRTIPGLVSALMFIRVTCPRLYAYGLTFV